MEEKEYETKNISITACSGDGNESFCRTAVSKYTSAGVTGQGVVSGADMNVGFMDLTTTDRYESISFDFSAGAGKSDIETFVRQLRFTTANKVQKVSVCATTEGTSATTEITVNGKTVELKYFNGHYYGFVPDRISWNEAYKISKTLNFNGVQGYLMTLTSRAEDRFILSSFPLWGNKAKEGWMGCTRAILASGSTYTDAETQWEPLKKFKDATKDEYAWRWVSGPETGTIFGYQTTAFGYGTGDGGFETLADHCFR